MFLLECVSLYEILNNFAKFIFKKFKINITDSPTLPSLAFKIFRTKYMSSDSKIPIISGKIFNNISQAFYGGHVDMYIPFNKDGELIHGYDVNSLYPNVMKSYKYPYNIFGYFSGDITTMIE